MSVNRNLMGWIPKSTKWATAMEISDLGAPAETFKLDPSLPVLGQDPKFTTDLIVIPKGRLIGVKAKSVTSGSGAAVTAAYTEEHEVTITVANGQNSTDNSSNYIAPLGYAGYNFLKKLSATDQWRPTLFKNKYIRLPYMKVTDSFTNSIFGDINQGDYVTAYPGYYSTATTPDPRHIGKVVKYVPRRVYATTNAGTSALAISGNASYSCFKPVVIACFSSAGLALSSTVTYTGGTWTVSNGEGNKIAACIYEYGQGPEMIAGQALSLEILDNDVPGWLKWVKDNYTIDDLPRQLIPGYSTATTLTGTQFTDLGNGAFDFGLADGTQIANYKAINVYVLSGCIYRDINNTPTTAASTAQYTLLPRYTNPASNDYSYGQNYTIDPVLGTIQFWGVTQGDGTALENTDIKVTYSYDTIKFGASYDGGIANLTDGVNTYAGTPPEYDVAGSVGMLKVMIF